MILTFLLRNKIKVIGHIIIFFLIIIPTILFFSTMKTSLTHFFGNETDSEKINRLSNNVKVLEKQKSIVKKEAGNKIKLIKIKTKLKKDTIVKTIVINKKKDSIIKDLDKKIDEIKYKPKVKKKVIVVIPKHKIKLKKEITLLPPPPKLAVKETPIVKVEDKVKYQEAGNVMMDSMVNAYVLINKIKD